MFTTIYIECRQPRLVGDAEDVLAAGGSAGVWLARPGSAVLEREVAGQMAVARVGEYEKVIAQALAAAGLAGRERDAVVRRLWLR